MPAPRIPVAVLGATGTVGQRFVTLLEDHPWLEIGALMASERSAGRPYGEAARWVQARPIPERVAAMSVRACEPSAEHAIVFSALDADVAGPLERAFAEAGAFVVSNAKSHRMAADVPLVVPEVNPEHLELVATQHFGAGAILTNPNCSTIGLVLALAPLHRAFGVTRAHVVTLQALSGAGLPGVPALEITDNVIPFIGGEEEKIETETRKILGHVEGHTIAPAEVAVSATCTRVPVVDGHTLCVSVALERAAEPAELVAAWREFAGEPQRLRLPSAPERPTIWLDREDAPQPRLHRDLGAGMSVAIGRLRPCPLLDHKFVALSHNTLRGAAGGALLVAELAIAHGIGGLAPPR